MRTSHALGLLIGMGSLVGAVSAISAGCGSTTRPPIVDQNAADDDGGGLGFGGDSGGPTKACTGLQCQQKACSGGVTTTVTGKVYAPNGTLPLYNAIVYVPNSEPAPITKGATCDKCGAVTGDPIVTALTDPEGKFELKDVPVGKDIPLVIQIGKWRRQVKLPEVKECTENAVTDKELTRLPKTQAEGSMPQIALTTGGCDQLGCMLPKIGIAPTEFGKDSDGDSKAVHTYISGSGPTGAPQATTLWSDLSKLKKYDMVILSCECTENLGNKGGANGPAFSAMQEYLESGGRIFTTDFMYTWYRYSPNADVRAAINGRWNAPGGGPNLQIDTSFPKGQALADWLQKSAGLASGTTVTPSVVYGNFTASDPTKSQLWAHNSTKAEPRVVSINVPVGVPADQQCGKGVHIDAHVNNSGETVGASYPGGCGSKLLEGENLLAFFFFDLASCIQNEAEPPKPPPVK
ncbi:MAG: carboxypeptidase regulatory-like domain-containing protein [Deltaproteobacteria bacterium]|nr:carboxypeptidase regulatory-like domain-containing protein [Deltaproteobacteria bacterium]